MSIGFKSRGADGPLYHPERDFAYITPTLMKQAIENMSAPADPDIEEWVRKNNITDLEFVAAAEALGDAQRDFVNAVDPVTSLHQALSRRNYFSLRTPVRLLLEAAVGRVMIGAWFKAVREVTVVGEESPAQHDMCRFKAAVCEFAARAGVPRLDGNISAEVVLMRQDVLRAKLQAAYEELHTVRQALVDAENKATRLEIMLDHLPRWAQRFISWSHGNQTHYPGPE
jgi:hypothetical protein